MKKRIVIIFLFVVGILLIGLGIVPLFNKNDNTLVVSKPSRMDFIKKLSFTNESKKITICKTKTNCPHALNEELYNVIEYDYDSKVFQKNVINKYNNKVLEIYNDTIGSSKYPGNCKLGDIFNYYDVKSIVGGYHENSKFMSFSILTKETDYCTMERKSLKPIVYNYSKEKDKMLSTSEFIKLLGLDEKVIHRSLVKRLNNYNDNNKTNYTFEELIDDSTQYREVFFINNGELDVSFYNKIENDFDIAVIYGYTEYLKD